MNLNRDLVSPAALYLKGGLFAGLGLLSGGLLLWSNPSWLTAGLLGLCVWGWCRAYYFAFYVVGNYADPAYRFAGLLDFGRYLWRRGGRRRGRGSGRVRPIRDPAAPPEPDR